MHNTESTFVVLLIRFKTFLNHANYKTEKKKNNRPVMYGISRTNYFKLKKLELFPIVNLFLKVGRKNPLYNAAKSVKTGFDR